MAGDQDPTPLKDCFVIAPIGGAGSEIREHSDEVMKFLIRPVLAELGYRAERGDEISLGGTITSQVIDRILADELVIADLSFHNANVFYELAVRHAVRKPVVQIIRQGEAIPFDVQDTRTIEVNLTSLEGADQAKTRLQDSIRWVMTHNVEVVTPISYAITAQEMRGSNTAEQTVLREVSEVLPQVVQALRNPDDDPAFRRMRKLIEALVHRGAVTAEDLEELLGEPPRFDRWVNRMINVARTLRT